jgi:hypothetical protein
VLGFSMLFFLCFVEVWVSFGGEFATLGFGCAHQVFDKKLEPLGLMPRVQAFSPRSSETQAAVAQPTF